MKPVHGFFIGIIPGLILVLCNYIFLWRKYDEIRKMALLENQDFDLIFDCRQRFMSIINSSSIFRGGESNLLRKKKEIFIERIKFARRINFFCAIILAAGAFIGPLLVALLKLS